MKACQLPRVCLFVILLLIVLLGSGLPARATVPGSVLGRGFGPPRAAAGTYPAAEVAPHWPSSRSLANPHAAILWQPYPIDGGEMISIAMSPADAQTVYVGTRVAGVFKTTDGGATWQPARQGLTFYPIRNLEADPLHAEVLYAGTDFDGIWKTTDGGATWAPSSTGLDLSLVVIGLVVDPQDADILYALLAGGAGLSVGHVYRSSDGGATWQVRDNGIPRYLPWSEYIFGPRSMALDPGQPDNLYVGTLQEAYASTDAGANWVTITANLPGNSVQALALDSHHASRLSAIVGQEYYVYQGGTWQQISQGSYHPNGGMWGYLYYLPSDAAAIYSTGQMFTRSTDEGVNWSWDYDPGAGTIPEVAFSPSTPTTIYAPSNQTYDQPGGVYKTTDAGISWSPARQGITAVGFSAVAIDPQDPTSIYAGDDTGHIFRSLDGGATWERKQVQNTSSDCWGIVVDPLNSQHIYVAEMFSLHESTDQGDTFTIVEEIQSAPKCMDIAPGASSPFYVGTDRQGIYRSTDGGTTWSQVNQGVPQCWESSPICPILSLAIDPNVTTTVWAGTDWAGEGYQGGILRSTDGGDHWQVKGLSEYAVETIAVQPGNSQTILAATTAYNSQLYKSTDGGESWQLKLDDTAPVMDIVFDPRDPNTVYAATEGAWVLRSRDAGETWEDYSTGIVYPMLYSLAMSAGDPPLLLAASYGSGLYWLRPVLENRPPATPHSPTPPDRAIGVPLDAVLGWSSSDPDGDPLTYTVAFGASSPPPVVGPVTTTAYDPGPLVTGTTYYWVITATDGVSTTAGPVWSFTTIQPYNICLPILWRSTGGRR